MEAVNRGGRESGPSLPGLPHGGDLFEREQNDFLDRAESLRDSIAVGRAS
jgi:hypothetical protein